MPLIRLVSHPVRNKFLCDKMIFVDGIPEHLLYFKRNGKNYLKAPWTYDVTENIPEAVRNRFQPEPFTVNVYTPAPDKTIPPLDDEILAYGLVLDCQNGQGDEMWKMIERMIDDTTPRGEDLPVPVLVAPALDDEHRNLPWGIGPDEIQSVKLEVSEKKGRVLPPVSQAHDFQCETCQKSFTKAQALRMHKMKAKHQQVAVGV